MIKTIVIPIDGSAASHRAMKLGCDLAAIYDASVHFIHVTQSPVRDQEFAFGSAAKTVSVALHAPQAELHRVGEHLLEAAKEYAGQHGCSQVTTEIVSGNPTKRIVQTAKEIKADMIVMGSRGLGDASAILLGSVSHKVNHLSPCTCVTVN